MEKVFRRCAQNGRLVRQWRHEDGQKQAEKNRRREPEVFNQRQLAYLSGKYGRREEFFFLFILFYFLLFIWIDVRKLFTRVKGRE